ncbi:MAG: L-serine ammonia-lyase [Saprospiraceae bacterium]
MESISIFDIYKIGVGPSSSHTLGPWKAGLDFRKQIAEKNVDRLEIWLYGSLSKTGKGHATDKAVQLGLLGYEPETINTELIPQILADLKTSQILSIDQHSIPFDPSQDIIFFNEERPEHPNTMEIKAFLKKDLIIEETYLSLGGGFIRKIGEENVESHIPLPYPIETGQDLTNHINATGMTISEIVMQNELSLRSKKEIKNRIDRIFQTMKKCVIKGCTTSGILPGGLFVKRRAKELSDQLIAGQDIKNFKELELHLTDNLKDFNTVNRWVSCFALAVNEENAAMGRIVTSPTNGAAGVIPAVLLYYYFFCKRRIPNDIYRFFCTSSEIGSLFKKGATISAAEGGCQAEIGVSSAMAAAGLTEILGGTPSQAIMAAEIAMEHHLGLTCDPVGGLVQIPCIERNAMGAMKAITAANLALSGDPTFSKVDLDTVIKTMWDTAQSMHKNYKETSDGGLAYNISVVSPEC